MPEVLVDTGRRITAQSLARRTLQQGRLRRLRWNAAKASSSVASCAVGPRCSFEVTPGASFHIGPRVNFLSDFHGVVHGDLEIGENVFFNRWCYLCCFQRVTIGANSSFGESVSIHDEDHEIEPGSGVTGGYSLGDVTIGSGVWVGSHVTILSGATIGDRSVIGAGAVVRGTIPPDCVAVGVPARVVRSFNSETAGGAESAS